MVKQPNEEEKLEELEHELIKDSSKHTSMPSSSSEDSENPYENKYVEFEELKLDPPQKSYFYKEENSMLYSNRAYNPFMNKKQLLHMKKKILYS